MSTTCAIYYEESGQNGTRYNGFVDGDFRCRIACKDAGGLAPKKVCGTYRFVFVPDGQAQQDKDWKTCISPEGQKKRDCRDTLMYDGPLTSFKYPNGYPFMWAGTKKEPPGKNKNKFDNSGVDPSSSDPTISVTPIE